MCSAVDRGCRLGLFREVLDPHFAEVLRIIALRFSIWLHANFGYFT